MACAIWPTMRDLPGPRWFGPVLIWLCLLALVVALCGCVTVYDCGAGIKRRLAYAECQWDLSRGR